MKQDSTPVAFRGDAVAPPRPMPKAALWSTMLLAGALIGFWGALSMNRVSQARRRPPVRQAPDFELRLFEGDATFRLRDHRGQGVVMNFWASWCFPCREETPELEAAWRTYRDRGVVFVGVNVWDNEADAREFLSEFEVTYPNGPDIDEQVVELYRVQGVPTTVFIAPDGSISRTILGPLDPKTLTEAVERIVSQP